jgi:hypothetical protein
VVQDKIPATCIRAKREEQANKQRLVNTLADLADLAKKAERRAFAAGAKANGTSTAESSSSAAAAEAAGGTWQPSHTGARIAAGHIAGMMPATGVAGIPRGLRLNPPTVSGGSQPACQDHVAPVAAAAARGSLDIGGVRQGGGAASSASEVVFSVQSPVAPHLQQQQPFRRQVGPGYPYKSGHGHVQCPVMPSLQAGPLPATPGPHTADHASMRLSPGGADMTAGSEWPPLDRGPELNLGQGACQRHRTATAGATAVAAAAAAAAAAHNPGSGDAEHSVHVAWRHVAQQQPLQQVQPEPAHILAPRVLSRLLEGSNGQGGSVPITAQDTGVSTAVLLPSAGRVHSGGLDAVAAPAAAGVPPAPVQQGGPWQPAAEGPKETPAQLPGGAPVAPGQAGDPLQGSTT